MGFKRAAALVIVVLAAGCATKRPAPVVERSPEAPAPRVEAPRPAPPKPAEKPIATHVVKRGETLVGVALQYGLDYRELAAWNGIANPNVISVGQTLLLGAPAGAPPAMAATPVATPLAPSGPVIESRPLANTDKVKVEPRGQRLPYSDRNLAQLSAGDAGAVTPPAPPVPASPPARPRRSPWPPRRLPRPPPPRRRRERRSRRSTGPGP
ncbi:MAG: LysM peptidoglycan-binding domain-containing protein [Betaproteobacteria bacterium]|nr:LysM peptidoglycan-binding domain-containing protein [Betaproteobacteria bacterium]